MSRIEELKTKLLSEGFKPISGFTDYLINKSGEVFSLKTKRLVQYNGGYGYIEVNLRNKKRRLQIGVSALVLETFVGPRPRGYHAAHLNGVKTDNRLENLKWCTPKENNSHKVIHGTAGFGEKNSWAKLTTPQARSILKYKVHSIKKLAKRYKIKEATVRAIWNRTRWNHI